MLTDNTEYQGARATAQVRHEQCTHTLASADFLTDRPDEHFKHPQSQEKDALQGKMDSVLVHFFHGH